MNREKEELIEMAKTADQLAELARPDNSHFMALRKRAFELRERAREMDD